MTGIPREAYDLDGDLFPPPGRERPTSDDVLAYLRREHADLVADLAATLDLDAGVADALSRVERAEGGAQ